MTEPEPCDAPDPYKRTGYSCCYRKGHSTEFPHRFVRENELPGVFDLRRQLGRAPTVEEYRATRGR